MPNGTFVFSSTNRYKLKDEVIQKSTNFHALLNRLFTRCASATFLYFFCLTNYMKDLEYTSNLYATKLTIIQFFKFLILRLFSTSKTYFFLEVYTAPGPVNILITCRNSVCCSLDSIVFFFSRSTNFKGCQKDTDDIIIDFI